MKNKSTICLVMKDEHATACCIIDASNLVWVPMSPTMKMKKFKPKHLAYFEICHSDGSFNRWLPNDKKKVNRFSPSAVWYSFLEE
jgi:hypothetical protein